jgi:hypothetical protein
MDFFTDNVVFNDGTTYVGKIAVRQHIEYVAVNVVEFSRHNIANPDIRIIESSNALVIARLNQVLFFYPGENANPNGQSLAIYNLSLQKSQDGVWRIQSFLLTPQRFIMF